MVYNISQFLCCKYSYLGQFQTAKLELLNKELEKDIQTGMCWHQHTIGFAFGETQNKIYHQNQGSYIWNSFIYIKIHKFQFYWSQEKK